MPNTNPLSAPKRTRFDAVIEGVKAGLEGPQGIVAALITPPIERRRDEWMNEVGRKLIELSENIEGFDFEALAKDEAFVTTILQSAQAAIRTHEIEKKVALRNAVLNLAIHPDLRQTQSQVLLYYLDTLTVWHLRILDLFANPQDWFERHNIQAPSGYYTGSRLIIVENAFPELKDRRDFYDPIIRDLYTKGLIRIENTHGMVTQRGMMDPCATEWGVRLVQLIHEPDVFETATDQDISSSARSQRPA